jgi:hypothetical protein
MAKKNKAPEVSFDTLLILFRFFLSQVGVSELRKLGSTLNDATFEGVNADGYSYFYEYLKGIPNSQLNPSDFQRYDERIMHYVKQIGEKRGGLRLKYFQYLSLLFTEMYLDNYFANRDAFLQQLNAFLHEKANESLGGVFFSDYQADDLSKIAFMCATGSGKTLIMHINILQYLYYFKRAKRTNSSLSLNRILLVTPNEGLSDQHLTDLELSGIPARIFSKEGLFSAEDHSNEVLIIDINKFADKMGDKTVAVESFESHNLVLVDEAHRGLTSGDVWVKYRKQLSEDGFTFEYSATFKQALNANAKKADERAALEEYGKSIIMDYSYKYFYNDGYGKDYRIYNLNSAYGDESRQVYLVGCLLTFYQQMKFYTVHRTEMTYYHIAKPLLIFVGNRVTATEKSTSELSDVQEVLTFLDGFVRNKRESIRLIEDVLHLRSGLVNASGSDLFEYGLNALIDGIYAGQIPKGEDVYADMLRLLFNSDTNSESPRLHVENIKQVKGEIALKIGEYGQHFGVINIGAPADLLKTLAEKGIVTRNEEFLATSLFKDINNPRTESSINILIGSRKFTEGWNSWRVSIMGLINFAKKEGSQAIQLFGRGVRLQGIDFMLKRSNAVKHNQLRLPYVNCVETLTVFGVKAQYMESFKQFLEEEGAPTNEDFVEINLPVVSRYAEAQPHKLRVIRVRNGVDFKKQSRRLILAEPEAGLMARLVRNPIQIDCQSKVQSIVSKEIMCMMNNSVPELYPIPDKYLPLLDVDRIYQELIEYKNEKGYFNICVLRENLLPILRTDGWYKLIIPGNKLELRSYAGLDLLTDFAILALKAYFDKFFKYHKEEWEAPYLEYAELQPDDNNFVDSYTIRYTPSSPSDGAGEGLMQFVRDASAILQNKGTLDTYQKEWKNSLFLFDFRHHLYAPLVSYKATNYKIQITPVSLNEGEKMFVDYLDAFIRDEASVLEGSSLFLLRNKSKAGIGFFEADNFYPDFILWIDTPQKQYITFIDPKGLLQFQPTHAKIQFYKRIKELEARLQPQNESKKTVLNSFIMSVTPAVQLTDRWSMGKDEREAMNVYTLDDERCVSLMIRKVLNNNN